MSNTYTAILLDEPSQNRLKSFVAQHLGENYRPNPGTCHHVTLYFPSKEVEKPKGIRYENARVFVRTFAFDENVIAVGVECFYEDGSKIPCGNKHAHITLAIGYSGEEKIGKAYQSNFLENWIDIDAFELQGTVKELEI